MKSAYLLAFVDVSRNPPAVVGVGIYSDHERGITLDRSKLQPVRVTDAVRHTYDEARRQILQDVERESAFAWVRPLMAKRDAG